MTGTGRAPSTASAVVVNVTVTDTTDSSYLTAYPTGSSRPWASNLNWIPGQTVANLVTVPVSSSGQVSFYNAFGSVDVVADLEGYYSAPSGSVGTYFPIEPFRILDTRASSPFAPAWGMALQIGGSAVPADATAVALNVTVTDTTDSSFLAVAPQSLGCPTSSGCVSISNLNWSAGQTVSSRVVSGLGPGPDGSSPRYVYLYNNSGYADVVVDVVGWFTSGSDAAGASFTAMAPCRLYDHRAVAEGNGQLPIVGACGIPAGTNAVVANLTASEEPAPGWLAAYGKCRASTSDLNWAANQTVPNLDLAPLDPSGSMSYTALTQLNLTVDATGYFTPSASQRHVFCMPVQQTVKQSQWTVTVYDSATGLAVPGDQVTFTARPGPFGNSQTCSAASLGSSTAVTDVNGQATVTINQGSGQCLISAADTTGASASAVSTW